ncbi:MAG: hypothetical protein CL917_17575 [Deltaproteobacteria bacterium]|nr:hypothetical protein [Deltaproteobacteria bacterium]
MEDVRLWSSPWAFEPFLLFSIGLTLFIYLRGFRVIHRQLPQRFPSWRRNAFVIGLGILFLALASPLDGLADLLLQAHMVQHWLLMMVIPPLIWFGLPGVPLLRGLPGQSLKRGVGPLLASPTLQRVLRLITRPTIAWSIWAITTLLWHWPGAYEAALHSRGWHDFEHACFLSASLLLWYPIIRPWPAQDDEDYGSRLIYIGAIMLFNTLFSATFAFSGTAFYETYDQIPKPWNISAVSDQNTAGAFMWIASSIPMLMAAIAIITKWLSPTYAQVEAPEFSPKNQKVTYKVASSKRPGWLYSMALRRWVQFGLLFLAAVIVADGLLGPSTPSAENLAGVLPWTYWRGFVVIGIVAFGNIFCAVCPFTLSRRLAALILRRPFAWPSFLKNKWLAVSIFLLYLWAYETFSLWDSPAWTAWLIVGYFSLCFLIEGLFPRGTFCRYVCPIGQFNFTSASLSPFEVQALNRDTCRSCTTQDCLLGNQDRPGCPTDLFLPSKAGNNDCTFCLDCVRACPHENAAIVRVLPAQAIGQNRIARRTPTIDWVVLCSVIVFGAFVNAAAMVAPIVEAESEFGKILGIGPSLTQTIWFLLGLILVPFATITMCATLSRKLSKTSLSLRRIAVYLVPAFIPLGFAMWLSHLGFHLVTSFTSIIPAVERVVTQFFPGFSTLGMAPLVWNTGDWMSVELIILGIGFLVTLGVGWRLSQELAEKPSVALKLALPWVGLAAVLYFTGAWILLQPMEMRGMVM